MSTKANDTSAASAAQPDVAKYDSRMRADAASQLACEWHSPKEPPFALAGLAWFQQDRAYRRMPLHPPEPLPEGVNNLANCPSGAQIRFQSNTRLVSVKVKLAGVADLCHTPATGQCGFDLYIGPPGKQVYISTTKYDHKLPHYECLLFERMRLKPENRSFTLNFPFLKGVEDVLVGLEPGANITPPLPFLRPKPVVIYGTSITHGGCASRPGMTYTNILSRRLGAEIINLGFGGCGKGEPSVARSIALIPNPACFVLDYEANVVDCAHMQRTLPEFVRILRASHPTVPLVVVSKVRYSQENFNEGPVADRLRCRDFEKSFVEQQRAAGDASISFLDMGAQLSEKFSDGTVDGVHPNDLGFDLMADVFEPVLRKILF
jgi:hypothetical protein